jgi:hypothetical protein
LPERLKFRDKRSRRRSQYKGAWINEAAGVLFPSMSLHAEQSADDFVIENEPLTR